MGSDATVKDINLAFRQSLAQVIEGTAIAQTQFQNRPWHAVDKLRRRIETVALCGDPA
jgi:hypothetical protein